MVQLEVWRRGEWNRHSLRKGRNFATGCSTLRASEGSSEILLCEFRRFLQLCRSHAQAVMTGSRNLALLCCAWLSACQHMILDAGITPGSHPECFCQWVGFCLHHLGFCRQRSMPLCGHECRRRLPGSCILDHPTLQLPSETGHHGTAQQLLRNPRRTPN